MCREQAKLGEQDEEIRRETTDILDRATVATTQRVHRYVYTLLDSLFHIRDADDACFVIDLN